ncbi:type VI secretion system tip protein TssI/VgrG [Xanthomonas campestris pv. raphani]|uniref:type VI secretion system Vgr family protein n=1 Tax=Xanthomonas campestris TaxID=339 RepID=UPI002367D5B7|nr:type VI secretion system tip protein VgrG [Xanthomonas campestris]MEA9822364.1 type VI secretion system tip protein TssI/VgrG [Xanthomonas campestris pv. raphani]MEA9850903.1 type VI secretion system tip protein TssI/VgrG [Xanthomonas campestris pv. raphani]MEA9855076.1 type VI secretion system tip protein TssI/VgrG [Xanthomonas campestris pv. raphani]MEA9963807.1 type VI secretion system tip protein TssI/VgrG [Xanthomonas campestris pv. raphani]WDJ20461.1 type VI secretion system tip prote
MTRRVTIQTPVGDQLQFRQLKGEEAISQLFRFDIDLLSDSKGIDPKALLGKNATVVVETQGGGVRHLDGIVTRFGMQGEDHRYYAYRLELSPWLWLATRKSDFKIFQGKTAPEIIEQVLGKYGYPMEKRLTRSYRTWDYCVQYNETDYQFVSRLMEHEGIYYFHQHNAGQHTLTLADDIVASHSPLPGAAVIPFYPPEKAAVADKENIHAWQLSQSIHSGRHYNDDYDFTKPRADLSNMRQTPPGHAHDSYEMYEWPGGYTDFGDGEAYARVRLQESLTGHSIVRGQSRHRALAPGYTFTLENYPREDQNQQYLLTSLEYHFKENPQVSAAAPGPKGTPQEEGSFQKFTLQAQPTTLPYTPARTTPKPKTTGPQTAVVVGPPGEEIWPDQYGRVKVQFHWDRVGAMDENSSCWVRVSSSWAGSGFGAMFIPRIGHEVVVDFLNGDPDYPIITGCVYNANNMPPWSLPGNATQSGIKTKSSKGGAFGDGLKNGAGDANAIRFEDKAGAEQLWLHAQKDQLSEVENDEDRWIGHDLRTVVDHDETRTVHHDRVTTIDNDETQTVHNDRKRRVDHNETLSVGDNRRRDVGIDETVSIGKNRTQTIGRNEKDKIGNNWSIKVGSFKTETIGLAYLQNVGLAKMMNIGAAYNVNVGAAMIVNVGLTQSTNVLLGRSVTVGQSQTTKVEENWSQTTGKVIRIEAGDSIELVCGASVIKMEKGGQITVNGKEIDVVGAKHIGLDSKRIDLN